MATLTEIRSENWSEFATAIAKASVAGLRVEILTDSTSKFAANVSDPEED